MLPKNLQDKLKSNSMWFANSIAQNIFGYNYFCTHPVSIRIINVCTSASGQYTKEVQNTNWNLREEQKTSPAAAFWRRKSRARRAEPLDVHAFRGAHPAGTEYFCYLSLSRLSLTLYCSEHTDAPFLLFVHLRAYQNVCTNSRAQVKARVEQNMYKQTRFHFRLRDLYSPYVFAFYIDFHFGI